MTLTSLPTVCLDYLQILSTFSFLYNKKFTSLQNSNFLLSRSQVFRQKPGSRHRTETPDDWPISRWRRWLKSPGNTRNTLPLSHVPVCQGTSVPEEGKQWVNEHKHTTTILQKKRYRKYPTRVSWLVLPVVRTLSCTRASDRTSGIKWLVRQCDDVTCRGPKVSPRLGSPGSLPTPARRQMTSTGHIFPLIGTRPSHSLWETKYSPT